MKKRPIFLFQISLFYLDNRTKKSTFFSQKKFLSTTILKFWDSL